MIDASPVVLLKEKLQHLEDRIDHLLKQASFHNAEMLRFKQHINETENTIKQYEKAIKKLEGKK